MWGRGAVGGSAGCRGEVSRGVGAEIDGPAREGAICKSVAVVAVAMLGSRACASSPGIDSFSFTSATVLSVSDVPLLSTGVSPARDGLGVSSPSSCASCAFEAGTGDSPLDSMKVLSLLTLASSSLSTFSIALNCFLTSLRTT